MVISFMQKKKNRPKIYSVSQSSSSASFWLDSHPCGWHSNSCFDVLNSSQLIKPSPFLSHSLKLSSTLIFSLVTVIFKAVWNSFLSISPFPLVSYSAKLHGKPTSTAGAKDRLPAQFTRRHTRLIILKNLHLLVVLLHTRIYVNLSQQRT